MIVLIEGLVPYPIDSSLLKMQRIVSSNFILIIELVVFIV